MTLQEEIDYFRYTYGFREQDVSLIPFGSRVYGTHRETSDYDFIGIIPDNRMKDTGTEYRMEKLNVHMFNGYHFKKNMLKHKIEALEAFFHSEFEINRFKFELDLVNLRHEISSKSSHSFVKAKKKIIVEKEYHLGWKSLFHSLRILNFGIQVAKNSKISDYSAANKYWEEINSDKCIDWDILKEKYQPVFNELASEFRKLAPKLRGEK